MGLMVYLKYRPIVEFCIETVKYRKYIYLLSSDPTVKLSFLWSIKLSDGEMVCFEQNMLALH